MKDKTKCKIVFTLMLHLLALYLHFVFLYSTECFFNVQMDS